MKKIYRKNLTTYPYVSIQENLPSKNGANIIDTGQKLCGQILQTVIYKSNFVNGSNPTEFNRISPTPRDSWV